jgi:NifU-like protein
MAGPLVHPRLVCRCRGVASPRIFEAVRTQGLCSVAEVTKAVRAGGGCGTCHPEIEEILADAAGEPVDPALRLENRLLSESETCGRIEATLDSRVRPALAERGVSVASFTIDALTVRVVFEGAADEETLRLVRDELRRFVCNDLEVVAESS